MSRFDRVSAFEVASFKALDTTEGEFEALVSVFGNVDRGGERVVKGAFTKSLSRWEESGDPIPVIWNHMWENPEAHIGAVNPGDAVETADGLKVRGRLDLDNPFAKQVYRLLSERRVKEFSFGYDLKDSEKKDGALDLLEIDLFELGPTLKGMNPATELLAVKGLAAVTELQSKATDKPESTITVTGDSTITAGEVVAALKSAHVSDVAVKAGAAHSKQTISVVQQAIELLRGHFIAAGTAGDEPPKSDEAEAAGKASELDEDIFTRIRLLKEQSNVNLSP